MADRTTTPRHTTHDWITSTVGLAMLGAFLLWASLPPWDLWPLAWIAPVPWVLLIRRQDLPGRRPYRTVWLAGFLFWLGAYHWLRLPHWATSFGLLALAFYLAFYVPLFVGLSRVAVHRLRVPLIVAAPVVWTGLELLRGHLLTGITMASLGHTQYRWIDLIQISDLAGAYGVSFVVMLVAACVARTVPWSGQRAAWWPVLPAAIVLAAVLVYGHRQAAVPLARPTVRVALIQGSIDVRLDEPPEVREETFAQYSRLSLEAKRRFGRVDLIVWPETVHGKTLLQVDSDAAPPSEWERSVADFRRLGQYAQRQHEAAVGEIARELATPMIVGANTERFAADGYRCYNTAAHLSAKGELLGRYDKMHLVMFGEYVPFADRLPWLQRLTPLPASASAGQQPACFEQSGLRFSPNICYETVIPHVIRRQVREMSRAGREPDVLVNLTNDGWFWGSSELDMHLVCGVFRAVECRKPLLIAANTGFSASIAADGRILARGLRRATDVLLAEVGRESRTSPYLLYGDWFAAACLAATIVFSATGMQRRCVSSTAKKATK